MAQSYFSRWRGYLPARSLVMARKSIAALKGTLPQVEPQRDENAPAPQITDSLEQILGDIGDCKRCKLCEKRNSIVFGEGNPSARLMFIGEGPGEDEDRLGRPFVGKAGQLLDRMIEAMGLKRSEVYIANVVKCRPPGNRNPESDEISSCSPFLKRQIGVIRPDVIVGLGKFASQTLLQTETGITSLRGSFKNYTIDSGLPTQKEILFMPTFHPSYLLRNPEAKREVWVDLQQVAKALGISIPKRGTSN